MDPATRYTEFLAEQEARVLAATKGSPEYFQRHTMDRAYEAVYGAWRMTLGVFVGEEPSAWMRRVEARMAGKERAA